MLVIPCSTELSTFLDTPLNIAKLQKSLTLSSLASEAHMQVAAESTGLGIY